MSTTSALRIHCIEHVPFETAAGIGRWAALEGHYLSATRMFENPSLPSPDLFDVLVVMGGPMGANDELLHPWLTQEKRLIADSIRQGRAVLGICLGAQLIAATLGARVFKNREPEIGWFEVERTQVAKESAFGKVLPERCTPLHWHGDTFDLPTGSVHLLRSEGCEHQAFSLQENVLGLQFHLEMNRADISRLCDACKHELAVPGRFVAREEEILERVDLMDQNNSLLDKWLSAFLKI